MSTSTFNGYAGGSIAGGAAAYVFVGPTVTVTTTAAQRITGAAEAPLGVSTGTGSAYVGLCYQPSGGGTITNFVGGAYSIVEFNTTRMTYAASASIAPGAGTWIVGYCVQNFGAQAINDNDFVNGWVQVTN